VDLSSVSYIQKGQGKDLVFLHGYLSSKECFAAQIEYFSRFYRVTALDFIGFGKSAPLEAPFSVTDYAKWTEEALALLNVSRPHVVAHSFGCRVAVKMAALGVENGTENGTENSKSRGQVFDKILLTGPAGVVLPRGAGYKIKVKTYRMIKKISPRFAERRFGSQEYRSLSPVMRESYKKIVNEDLRADARKIENQTLIVEGKEDRTTPQKEAEIYLSCLKRGELKNIEGGHFAFAEYPVAFNLIAEEFFLS
jgi:pimeloyl-ACP methyl ester carboxylesterase